MANDKKPKPPAASPFFSSYLFEFIVLAIAAMALVYLYYQSAGGRFEEFMQNSLVARFVFVLKIVSAVVIVSSFVGIIVVAYKNASLLPPLKRSSQSSMPKAATSAAASSQAAVDAPYLKGEWDRLRERLKSASDADAVHIVLEADGLVDRALKDLRIPGETMGERLKFISTPDFKSKDDLWEAHKIRNQIAHGDGKDILYMDALYAFEKFEKALKELNMI